MNNLERSLITYVINGNMPRAKDTAKMILQQSTTKKDKEFCETMLQKLEKKQLAFSIPSNIQGCLEVEDVSNSFREDRYFLKDRELFEKIEKMCRSAEKLEEMGISFTNSCLLYGESGTGKTTFGKYVAYKLGLPFAYLNFSYILDSYMGNTGKNLSRCFDFVKQHRCVFMLDELDAIGQSRGSKTDVGEMNRILINLIQCIDNLPNNVLLLGATNRSDILDPALSRRFFHKQEMRRLDREERVELCRNYFESIQFPISEGEIIALAEKEQTQAELINEIVSFLASCFSE